MIKLIALFAMAIGAFLLFDIKPLDFADGLLNILTERPKSIRDKINEATNRKKQFYLKREIVEVKEILRLTGRGEKLPVIFLSCLISFVVGAVIAVIMENFFLLPVLAFGMMLFPLWYVKLTATYFKKDLAAELETALSIVTTAYLRNEDIITAVDENIAYLNPPVQDVFKEFLFKLKLVDNDVPKAIKEMKSRIENEVFHEWCDALAACQYDHNLKNTLTPIVSKLSDIRIVNSELDLLVMEPRKEFIIMVILTIGNIPLMYALNKSWYEVLMHTAIGKILIAVTALVVLISTAFVIKFTKPLEIKR
jgi:tight adherence protein B